MSQSINDGGPAFPRTVTINDGIDGFTERKNNGMTLRDYFAAAALQGLLASQSEGLFTEFATHAYQLADAMLKAREVKP